MIDRLKKRWGIKSNLQIFLILIAFSLAGSLTLVVKNLFFQLIGVDTETPLYIKIPIYILSIIPIYWVLLISVGTLLGQFKFFYNFGKKSISRFKFKK